MNHYNPSDWYWTVAGSTTLVWSSARAQYVPISDATYQAWLKNGNFATRILNAAELFDVLMEQWAPLAQMQGVAVASTSIPALNGTYAMDAASQAQISSLSTGIAAGKPLPGGAATFNYRDMTGAAHAFSGPNFLNFAAAIESYLYAFEEGLTGLLNAVSGAALPSNQLTIA